MAARHTQARTAQYLFDDGDSLPGDDLGPAGNVFCQEVRRWLSEHWSPEQQAEYKRLPLKKRGWDQDFSARIGQQGWTDISWAKAVATSGSSMAKRSGPLAPRVLSICG